MVSLGADWLHIDVMVRWEGVLLFERCAYFHYIFIYLFYFIFIFFSTLGRPLCAQPYMGRAGGQVLAPAHQGLPRLPHDGWVVLIIPVIFPLTPKSKKNVIRIIENN